ncbi:MAG: BamA/TamA family outer membrane protein [Planctomycetes bacterium]|nr:BamA/TamA family outer membrane protein [Planctomycetota bacterium]
MELPPPATPPFYDPLSGMERSGRIPRMPVPVDLPRPDRWRYIPEGRIPPGNMAERFLVTTFVSPIFYHEEDIGYGGGIALTDIDFRGQRRREFLGAFASQSSEGQEDYRVVWKRALHHRRLAAGGVAIEERGVVRASAGYERSRTRRFFGFGPESREAAETSFTDELSSAGAIWQDGIPAAGDDLVISAGGRLEHRNLTRGRVVDRPSTEDSFPAVVAAGDHHDALWLSAGVRWDTRDSQHQPYRGWVVGVRSDGTPAQTSGEMGTVSTLHALAVHPVWSPWHAGGDAGEENPPTDTVIIGGFVAAASGELPFWALPSLGGPDTLRGYIANRFTDRATWHATGEYRTWVVPRGFALTDAIRMERFGLAAFYDIGTVAPRLSALDDADLADSWGFGLRMAFERTAVFRVDVGFSDEDTTVTAAFGTSL